MNPISSPYYNNDPFSILPNNHSPTLNLITLLVNGWRLQNNSTEEDPSEGSQQYERASENPEDYPFNNPSSNYQSHNSETAVLYDPYMFLEPPYDGPFKVYFHAPPEYQNAYNDIMMGLQWSEKARVLALFVNLLQTIPIPTPHVNENASGSERERMLLNRIAELEREKAEVETRNALLIQALEEKNFRNF
ncbi:hypothetical protein L1987_45805 [Smallanthus sonchifolius]|uniref:Uncharacterized protein n=1 Tax=Smallanthus sonchifolius TaxID=185202 RepID=A0ACB9FZ09_9ASTR|nr:hypothetical protein L1987_45805 [Smallanthus sonchifolius]